MSATAILAGILSATLIGLIARAASRPARAKVAASGRVVAAAERVALKP